MKMKVGVLPEGQEITAFTMSATYCQEGDTNHSGEMQELRIEIEGGIDDPYFVISTERWAVDDLDDIIVLLQDFKKRISND